MKKLLPFLMASLVSLALSASAFAIQITPGFYSFGSVRPGQSSTAYFTVWNNAGTPVQNVWVTCSGDFSAFQCMDFCNYLPAYGTCSINVRFSPRNGDGMYRSLNINVNSSDGFAFATAQGIDARP